MECLYWYGDRWTTDERLLLSARHNSFWMGNSVFDGARAYDGVAPDVELHCARLNESALHMHLKPLLSQHELAEVCLEGARRFEHGAHLYIRPMYFATEGFIIPEPSSTQCVIVIHRAPLPDSKGFSACTSPFSRPDPSSAPTSAKASCLYPKTQHALIYARERGFDNAIISSPSGSVAEFSTSNLFLVRDGVVYTPKHDGSFLAGITRRRVISLLHGVGISVIETTVSVGDILSAEEVFSSGNYGKVLPVIRIDDVEFAVGEITHLAIQLYKNFAESHAL